MKSYIISLGISISCFFLHILNAWFIICFSCHCSYLISPSVAKGFVTWWLLNFFWILICQLRYFSIITFLYDMHCFLYIWTISMLQVSIIFCDDDKQLFKVVGCLYLRPLPESQQVYVQVLFVLQIPGSAFGKAGWAFCPVMMVWQLGTSCPFTSLCPRAWTFWTTCCAPWWFCSWFRRSSTAPAASGEQQSQEPC